VATSTPWSTRGMRNTGTESHGSDWPTSHPTVPMQVSVGTPRRRPRSCRRWSPSTADRLPPRSGLPDKALSLSSLGRSVSKGLGGVEMSLTSRNGYRRALYCDFSFRCSS
jgi:hypothetical protein